MPEQKKGTISSSVKSAEKKAPTPVATPTQVRSQVSGGAAAPVDIQAQVAERRSRWQQLATAAALGGVQGQMEALNSALNNLEAQIAGLRARDYRFGRLWERQLVNCRLQWRQQQTTATALLTQQRGVLQTAVQQVQPLLDQTSRNPGLLSSLDASLSALDSRIRQAENEVTGLFSGTEQELSSLKAQVAQAEFVLDTLTTASFKLLPQEAGIAACRAQWWQQDDKGPAGVLILTNARVIFEQREMVATKKVLFIATEKQEVKKLLWHAPIGAVQEVNTEDKSAFLSHKELLHLVLDSRDAPERVTVRLEGTTNEAWSRLIDMARTGQIEADSVQAAAPVAEGAGTAASAVPVAPVMVEEPTPKVVPTKCPSCGGKLPTLYKGMRSLTCEYCGTNVPVEY